MPEDKDLALEATLKPKPPKLAAGGGNSTGDGGGGGTSRVKSLMPKLVQKRQAQAEETEDTTESPNLRE